MKYDVGYPLIFWGVYFADIFEWLDGRTDRQIDIDRHRI